MSTSGTTPLPPKPRRAVALELRIGADDEASLVTALIEFTAQLQLGALGASGVDGGPAHGLNYEIRRDPSMTRARYFAAVDAWLAQIEPHPAPPAADPSGDAEPAASGAPAPGGGGR
jgi:hypothetical protein